jgi:hypothetical protein
MLDLNMPPLFDSVVFSILLASIFFVLANIYLFLFESYIYVGFSRQISIRIAGLATALGASLGTWLVLKFYNPFVLLAAAGAGFWLTATIRNELAQRQKLLAQYRKSEPHRIKP